LTFLTIRLFPLNERSFLLHCSVPKDFADMTIATPSAFPPVADQRSAEILDRVRRAFAEKGFDGASMQDLARATGMSVGNFYRYFPSKAAIVEALITRDLAEIEAQFSAIMESGDPLTGLRATLRHRITTDCAADGQLWAEITAAALRKSEISAITTHMETVIVRNLCSVFAHATGLPVDEAQRRYNSHALLLVMLVKASAMHPGQPGINRENLSALVLRTVDRTLDEVASDAAKG
jgi:AcrR family transcriptional regulator